MPKLVEKYAFKNNSLPILVEIGGNRWVRVGPKWWKRWTPYRSTVSPVRKFDLFV